VIIWMIYYHQMCLAKVYSIVNIKRHNCILTKNVVNFQTCRRLCTLQNILNGTAGTGEFHEDFYHSNKLNL
jgi:hypothetical protein